MGNGGRYITRLKYCCTCYIYRPERTFHCNFCGNCVHHFDHHCKWLGTCIGGRTYKQYFFFLLFLTLLEWASIGFSLSYIVRSILIDLKTKSLNDTLISTFENAPSSIIVILVCLIVGGFVTHLFLYHLMIICKS